MPIYSLLNNKLQLIPQEDFKLEKEIQTLTENNIEVVFGLQFAKSEFALHNFRIDTLAFDRENKSFVIIEYKRNRNFSVIDQGYAYLSLMLNNKADFILEYNENSNTPLKKGEVDWSQSKVIFVSPSFTTYQKEAVNFKDLPIELWEIKKYKNNIISFKQISKFGATETIKTITKGNEQINKVVNEVKVYTEDDHLAGINQNIVELYETLKNSILNLPDDIKVEPKKLYIAFIYKTNICDILLLKKSIKIWINLKKGELDDPKGIFKDVSQTGHWGNGDYETKIDNEENIEYIVSLIKQSLKKQKE